MTILMGSTAEQRTAEVLLIIQHAKQNDRPARRQLQIGVFLECCLIDGFLLGRIGRQDQSAIVQFTFYFDAYMGISHYVLVPSPAVRVRESCGIKGEKVELPLVGDTIDNHGMWKQIRAVGLEFDILDFVGEGPVGNRSRDELPFEP